MAHFTYEVGRLYCGEVRNFLNKCKFQGLDIDFIEGSGWLSREFTVKGSDEAISRVYKCIEDWSNEILRQEG